MGFSLKKLGRGIGKVGKKVGRVAGKAGKVLVKVAADRALGAAAGVVGAKAASYGAGVVNRVASAPARRRARKEKEARITKALAADIARPSVYMAASRDPNAATARPGGSTIGGSRAARPKNQMTVRPGGAPLKAPKTSGVTDKGLTEFLKQAAREKKTQDRARAATIRKQQAAEKKAAAAAARAAKKAAAASARAAKKAETARKKKAAKEGTFVGSAVAGALGVKVGGKGTQAAKITAAAKRKTQSLVRSAVRKSPGVSKAIPGVVGTAAILGAGGKALDANARRLVAKREKKLGRKLTQSEIVALTTPRNTYLGK